MEWSIQEVARLAGTTSRALRHYGELGLLHPSRVGTNGYRFYDEAALRRLQRILLLRELGLGLAAIAEVLEGQQDDARALRTHLRALRDEHDRLDRQIASVESTIERWEGGEQLMAEQMFDGFDHTVYQREMEERWGAEAYAAGDTWWRSKTDVEKREFGQQQAELAADWMAVAERSVAPGSTVTADGAEAQALAKRQFDWLSGIPGTPGHGASGPPKAYFVGLADLYADDDRFAANYGGRAAAAFVRDAMRAFADRAL